MVHEQDVHEPRHPATFSRAILRKLGDLVPAGIYLDPFAGTGKIHQLTRPDRHFVAVELEEEWASMDPKTICADALTWMRATADEGVRFDGVVTSPVYGNRMSDHHNAADASERRSYTHDLGRKLTEGNAGTMYFWQEQYKVFHFRAWKLAADVTRRGGMMYLNVKNFYRNKERVDVVGWHMKTLSETGWKIISIVYVGTPSMRRGENAHGEHTRFDKEAIILAERV